MIISFLNQGGGTGSGVTPAEVDSLIQSAITDGQYINNAEYISSAKTIVLYQDETEVATIDATAFIKDGMVDSVTVSGSILTIVFNTDAGKEPINVDLSDVVDLSNYYTKTDVDAIASGKADSSAVTAEIAAAVSGKADSSAVTQSLSSKQDTLVSGTNIKTINNESLLGSGNITISGGGGAYYIDIATLGSGITDEDWDGVVAAIDAHRPIYAGHPRQDGGILYYGVECMNKNVSNTEIVLTASDNNQHYFYTFTKNGSNDYFYTVETKPYVPTITTDVTSGSTDAEIPTAKATYDAIQAGVGGGVSSAEVETMISEAVSGKQDTLVSGTNIKTINNQSLLGSGNIDIQGGGGVTVDSTLDSGSTNPVQNGVITQALNNKLDASAYTPTDLSQYWTSAQTQTAIDDAKAYYADFAAMSVQGITDADWDGLVAAINAHRPILVKISVSNGYVNATSSVISDNVIYITGADGNYASTYTFTKNGSNDYSVSISTTQFVTQAEKDAWNAKVDASAIATAITSGSTDSEIPTAKAVYDQLGGLKFVSLTQSEYDQLATKDSTTIYFIKNNSN